MAKKARKIQPSKPTVPQQAPQSFASAFMTLIWGMRPRWRNLIVVIGAMFVFVLAIWVALPDKFKEALLSRLLNRDDNKIEASNESTNNSVAKDAGPVSQNQRPAHPAPPAGIQSGNGTGDTAKAERSHKPVSERSRVSSPDSKEKDTEEPLSGQSDSEAAFFELLKDAEDKQRLQLLGEVCRDYSKASAVIPQRFRGKVKFGPIKDAEREYRHNNFPDAVRLFEEAFQDVPRP